MSLKEKEKQLLDSAIKGNSQALAILLQDKGIQRWLCHLLSIS
jgi:hypothetical protein